MTEPSFRLLWGKADGDVQTQPQWHPLLYHMLDVAAVAGEVLLREPATTRVLHAQDFGFSDYSDAEPWILFFVALHDIGKASPSFQKLTEQALPQLKESLQSAGLLWTDDVTYIPHGDLGHFIFRKEIVQKESPGNLFLEHVSQAVNSHHGFTIEQAGFGAHLREAGLKSNQQAWKETRAELIAILRLLFVQTRPWPDRESLSGEGFMRLAGLTAFSDWIGSNTDHFPYFDPRRDAADIKDYWQETQLKATHGLNQVGWYLRRSLFPTVPAFEACFTFPARPLQKAVAELVSECTEPTLTIVEAPMGEGKTEAGFYAHVILQNRIGHRGMYVALPSQATGNAMFRRTQEFLEKSAPQTQIDLQLIHGASLLNSDYQNLKLAAIYDKSGIPNEKEFATIGAHEWFTNKKRALLSEYGVGTIDQALLSVLNVKHRFVRLWGLGNRTIIVDEVHAYDVYTSTILDRLLEWLKALGSSVILMSATLPAIRRRELLRIWGAETQEAVAYPRVTSATQTGKVRALHFAADDKRNKTVEIKPAPVDITSLAIFARTLVADGGCLAIIVNTVQRAQELFKELSSQKGGADLYIFHARFTAEMRKQREDRVLGLFGKMPSEKTPRPRKAILVGTQVLEQSLDLDFDVMISDLAPIDLLLQRVGRVHRHERPISVRCNHTKAVIYICGMGGTELPELGKPLYWSAVYEAYVLYRTWIELGAEKKVRLPEDIDDVIEKVYGESDIPEPWTHSELIKNAKTDLEKIREDDQAQAMNNMLGRPSGEQWSNPSGVEKDEDENPNTHPKLMAKTRKGDRSITAVVLFRIAHRLYLDESGEIEIFLNESPNFNRTRDLYKNSISLSRWDVYRALKHSEVPTGWRKNSLLRNCRTLEFENSMSQVGFTSISYSTEIGISYEKRES